MSKETDYCPFCGNEIPLDCSYCPYCENELHKGYQQKSKRQFMKTVNIKSDQPDIDTAHSRLLKALHSAKANRVKILKIIHGYGSSGIGGDICWLVRDFLEKERYSPLLEDFIAGENFSKGNSAAVNAVRKYPQLKKDKDWNRKNRGITIVIIK